MASLARFIEGRLRLKINQDKSAVARPEDRHFLGFRLRVRPADRIRGDPAVGAHEAQRDGQDPAADAAKLGRQPGKLHALSINAWLRGWHKFFGIALPVEEMHVMRAARRSHQASATRDHPAPLETQTNDRRKLVGWEWKAGSVARVYGGTQIPLGAEPHTGSR